MLIFILSGCYFICNTVSAHSNLLQSSVQFQQPSNVMAQRKFNSVRDPCSVLWDVLWDDLITMELTNGKKDRPMSSPSQLILYLRTRPTESKENTRVIKCIHESQQAFEIYSSIERAMIAYGPKHSKVLFLFLKSVFFCLNFHEVHLRCFWFIQWYTGSEEKEGAKTIFTQWYWYLLSKRKQYFDYPRSAGGSFVHEFWHSALSTTV